MPARPIRLLGDPVLWEPGREVIDFSAAELPSLVRDLDETLSDFRRRTGFGRGIAAHQIGVPRRVIFIRMLSAEFEGPLINPVITKESSERIELWDDCFSFPDLLVHVSRARFITVEYLDLRGVRCTLEARDGLSELLQHEIDHTNGILAVERAVSRKGFMLRSEWERRRSIES
jgi:peptide deformylase